MRPPDNTPSAITKNDDDNNDACMHQSIFLTIALHDILHKLTIHTPSPVHRQNIPTTKNEMPNVFPPAQRVVELFSWSQAVCFNCWIALSQANACNGI
eukprot:scaffold53690_cov17-Prasinocladus_malaysianus.AAC.1